MEEEKEGSKTESFAKNSLWNALGILLAKGGGMLFAVILARFLLPEKFGIYTLALSITMFLLSLTNLAMNQTASRYLSNSIKLKNKNLAGAYFKFISNIKNIFSFLTFFLLMILAYPLSVYIFNKPGLFLPLILFGIYAVFLSIQNLYETLFYVIGKVKLLTLKEIILQSIKLIICLGFFLIFSASLSVAIFSIIFSSLVAILFMKFYLNKHIPFLFHKNETNFDKPRVKKFIKNSVVSSVFTTLFDNIDMILLGIFVTSEYVGYYSAAFLVVGGFYGLISLSNLSLPLFTRINNKKTKKVFESLFRYSSIVSIPLIFGILVLGKYLLRLLYGYDYLESTIPLALLSILIFELPLTENLKSFLLSKEKPEVIARIIFVSTIINIILSVILVSVLSKISMLFAVIGIAIALIISRFVILISLSVNIKKNFKIFYNIKFLVKPIFSSLIMIVPIIFINSQISNLTFLIGFMEVILGAIVYFLTMWLIKGVQKEDINIVKNLFTFHNRFFHLPSIRKFFTVD
jgi:stage V sporulation protein B